MLLRVSSIAIALLTAAPTMAATPPTGPQEPPPLPDGQPVENQRINFNRAAGFSQEFAFATAGVETQRAYVYADGVIALEERLADDFGDDHRPLGERGRVGSPILVALQTPLGGTCPDWAEDEAAAFNHVEYTVEDDELVVIWRAMLPAEPDCSSKLAPQASTFTARLSWSATFDVTYTYYQLAQGQLPRAGVMLPQGAFELLPDEDKPRTDRAFALAADGSEGFPGDENRPRTWVRGVWAMSFDAAGGLVGDIDADGSRSVDNCPELSNVRQRDLDLDGDGDVCDSDRDDDLWFNGADNCPNMANPDQLDTDRDGRGDRCDRDDDGDGIFDHLDTCPLAVDPANLDLDGDGVGDACDPDIDGDDAVADPLGQALFGDLCPRVFDPARKDTDLDGIGDACDLAPRHRCPNHEWCRAEVDADGDGIADIEDVCRTVANRGQTDTDGDGIGNLCDGDCNGDGRLDVYQPTVQMSCVDFVWRDVRMTPAPLFTPDE